MSQQQAGGEQEDVIRLESPYHWVNNQGLTLRLQVMLTVQDEEDRTLVAQTEDYQPGHWWIPAETLRPNEPVEHAASRIGEEWLGADLSPTVDRVITWPANVDAGERKWFIVHVYTVEANPEDLDEIPDGVTVEWLASGDSPPGPWAADHGSVWKRLSEG